MKWGKGMFTLKPAPTNGPQYHSFILDAEIDKDTSGISSPGCDKEMEPPMAFPISAAPKT